LQPPNGVLRGKKSSLYEGGHREPFIARWPGRIIAGTESAALFAHLDMIKTFATLTGQKLPAGAAPDAVDVLPALLGEKGAKGRDELVLQNNRQAPLALRSGSWKLVNTPDGKPELYDLASDLSEKKDLAAEQPERVAQLTARLNAIRGDDVPVNAPPKGKRKKD
jgi:arylsulfatase A